MDPTKAVAREFLELFDQLSPLKKVFRFIGTYICTPDVHWSRAQVHNRQVAIRLGKCKKKT